MSNYKTFDLTHEEAHIFGMRQRGIPIYHLMQELGLTRTEVVRLRNRAQRKLEGKARRARLS